MSWSQLGDLAAAVGPWFVFGVLGLFLVWAFFLVWMVLKSCGTKTTDRDVSVKVRPFPWPRVEIEIKSPPPAQPDQADDAAAEGGPAQPAALPAASDVQPVALPVAGSAQQPATRSA